FDQRFTARPKSRVRGRPGMKGRRRWIVQVSVLVERISDNGYRARGSNPFPITARGATREEALDKLRAKIQAKLQNGTELVALEIGPRPHPWLEFAGMFKDDP